MAEYFYKGLLIGFLFGVPAGAIGALTIGRTLDKGFTAGFLTGMGSSAADLIYSCVGVFGITVVSNLLSGGQNILQIIGGILILLLGVGVLCKKKAAAVQKESKGTLFFLFSVGIYDDIGESGNRALVHGSLCCFWDWGRAGCSSLTSKEEPQKGIADMEFQELSTEFDSTGQPEVQGSMETEEINILMKIGDEAVAVEWEDNESVSALTGLLREQPLSIQMSMYGDFEQVGSLGTSLPRKDEQTTTQAGDIVLYSGNQIVVFYGSNSWAYTRLGKITDKSAEELEELLGSGDVTIKLELQ